MIMLIIMIICFIIIFFVDIEFYDNNLNNYHNKNDIDITPDDIVIYNYNIF